MLRERVCFLHQGIPPVWHVPAADGICDKDVLCILCILHLSTCTRVTLKPIDLTQTCFTQWVMPSGFVCLQRIVLASEMYISYKTTLSEWHYHKVGLASSFAVIQLSLSVRRVFCTPVNDLLIWFSQHILHSSKNAVFSLALKHWMKLFILYNIDFKIFLVEC